MAGHAPHAVCLGEAIVVLAPDRVAPLEEVEAFHRSVGRAESNVAGGLAPIGVSTAWVSRLGGERFGRYVARDLTARGVDIGGVAYDAAHPAGSTSRTPGPALPGCTTTALA